MEYVFVRTTPKKGSDMVGRVLLSAREGRLHITGTDLEVELEAASTVSVRVSPLNESTRTGQEQ